MESLLKRIPQDFPLSLRPYRDMAETMEISESDLISGLKDLKAKGVIRRVAAVLHHRKAAYLYNAMVVWNVPEQERERVGELMAEFPEVSHCYERDSGGYWNYTLYTMIHGRSEADCPDIARRISEKTGITDYRILYSKREFKKVSLTVNIE
jgi:siroheme decarboxylase